MKPAYPPKLLMRFFKWFCHKDLHVYVEGDLLELYKERVVSLGRRKADMTFFRDVLLLIRPSLIRPLGGYEFSGSALFFNYFKTSFRGLTKNPLSSFINVFGLSAAIAVCVFGYGFARWTYGVDQFHVNKNEIYLATVLVDRDGTLQQNGRTPRPLGKMMEEDFTHIDKICRVDDRNVIVKYGKKVFHERVRYTDPEFLEMFTFPMEWGLSSSLIDVNSIILSADMSTKYFGYENPIGFDLLVKFDEHNQKTFKITGVAKEFPPSHDIDFDFLINYENLKVSEPLVDHSDWSSLVTATFIQVNDPFDLTLIEGQMDKYQELQNEVETDWAISSFVFERWNGLYHKSGTIRNDISTGSDSNVIAVIYITAVSFFLLMLACFNYMNIAIVSAAKRLKEIGIRKTIGATKKTVMMQFLVENVVVTSFALFFGVILGSTVIIPWFEDIANFSMGFTLNDPALWLFLPSILLFTAVLSGAYPAIYISRFQVTGILKGSLRFGRKNPVTKIFLSFQIMLACIFIAIAVMFTRNHSYMAERSWGYDQDRTLYVRVKDRSAFEQMQRVMLQDPKVILAAGSRHHVGRSLGSIVIDKPDRSYEVDLLKIDANYLETMGIQLIEGRNFKENHTSDELNVIVNEVLVDNLKWEEAIGQVVKIDSVGYKVVGVVKNFHSSHFDQKIRPMIFQVADPTEHRFLSMKVRGGDQYEVYKAVQQQWSELFPEIPFQGGYQEDVWGRYFQDVGVHGKVWRGLAVIAIILASLGLYGLVTLNVTGRVKEFSIRRVMGAGLTSVGNIIVRQYLLLFAVALLVGAPISYFLIDFIFEMAYAYHIPIDFSGASISVLLLLSLLFLVVLVQSRKISKSNPVTGLKVE